jgi:hypothetical protein
VQAFNCGGQRGARKHPSAELGVQAFDLVIAPVAPRLLLTCLVLLPLCYFLTRVQLNPLLALLPTKARILCFVKHDIEMEPQKVLS